MSTWENDKMNKIVNQGFVSKYRPIVCFCMYLCYRRRCITKYAWITFSWFCFYVDVIYLEIEIRYVVHEGKVSGIFLLQWNLSVMTTSTMKFITCDLFSSVF